MIDVVARHYRDALDAVPDDPDAEQIRSEAVAALLRGAQRALRSGAPRGASANYAAAAGLLEEIRRTTPEFQGNPASTGAVAPSADAAASWEAAAEADLLVGDYEAALDHAERAAAGHAAAGRLRDAARAQALAGRALSLEGRTTEAHDRLSAAVQVLRPEPDGDTVRVLAFLGGLAAMTGSGDADSLTSEALRLGQALDVEDGELGRLFSNRGLFLGTDNRPAEAIASFEYAARVAERSGNSNGTAVALSNLSDMLLGIDPQAAADAARASCDHARRIGGRSALAYAASIVDRVDLDRGLGRRGSRTGRRDRHRRPRRCRRAFRRAWNSGRTPWRRRCGATVGGAAQDARQRSPPGPRAERLARRADRVRRGRQHRHPRARPRGAGRHCGNRCAQ